jgi:anti-anti-sigma factor
VGFTAREEPGDLLASTSLIQTSRLADGTAVVEVRGELDLGICDHLRRVLVDTATRLRPPSIVVDLLHVTFIDSTGIGALAAGHNAAHGVGIGFVVRHPSDFVARQLRSMGLYEVLTGR